MHIGKDIPLDLLIPRKLSFSLVLSDSADYEGGALEFFTSSAGPSEAEQKRGRVIAFPSYMVHRVTPITKGVRKSIVFWVVGPKFK
jgi:PKHD-type hydroxylase